MWNAVKKKEESINVCACIFVLRAKVLHVIIETCANSAPRYSMKTFSCACSYTTEFVQLRNRKVKFVRQFLPFLCMCEFWLHNKRGSKATELHAVVRISARYMFVCTLPSQLERANNALIYAEAQTAIFCTACSRDGPCFCLFPLLWLPLVHVWRHTVTRCIRSCTHHTVCIVRCREECDKRWLFAAGHWCPLFISPAPGNRKDQKTMILQ